MAALEQSGSDHPATNHHHVPLLADGWTNPGTYGYSVESMSISHRSIGTTTCGNTRREQHWSDFNVGREGFDENLCGALAGSPIHVVMGHQSDGLRADGAGQHAALAQGGDERCWSVMRDARYKLEDDDVGLHAREIEVDAGKRGDGFGEQACVVMVFGEPRGHFREGNESGGGENAGLAHAAAESFAIDASLGDSLR